MSSDAINVLAKHVAHTRFEDLPDEAVAAAKKFILDSLGVAVSGSRGPHVDDLYRAAQASGGTGDARVLGTRWRLPGAFAALMNAYQIHNAEFDCVHEDAVVHPMAVLLGALVAHVDRERQAGRSFSGKELIAAVCVGVDVGAGIGVASRSPLSFFRPATAGGYAAAAALGKLEGFDEAQLVGLMGLMLGQSSGTMQAHTEGSVMLAMQVGFNSRSAICALDMARTGIAGPTNVLEGPYGYYALFEGAHDLPAMLAELGKRWRITEVAHKPFPSGRATHGIVDACLTMAREHGFGADSVARVECSVPPLTHRLIGRPVHDDMEPNYSRLCAQFVAARALLRARVDLDDFTEEARSDAATLELARRIRITQDDNPDPNALTPLAVRIELEDGATHERTLDVIYGNPANPMTRDAYLEKFTRNLEVSRDPLAQGVTETAIQRLEALEGEPDVAAILDLLCAPA